MLEKIGLPAKPSLRGNTWVVDASHCQGCSSQFTFINRKHHCRRCGGLFCNSCTQQRMVMRGQGDSPVRICEPCKKLEEAARFEMVRGYKSRGKGNSKIMARSGDEVLSEILDPDGKGSISSRLSTNNDMDSGSQRATSDASCSNTHNGSSRIGRNLTVNDQISLENERVAGSPEELRQRALEEKKKYKTLKGEGKPEEALRAYKRGKELERQAEALEMSMRKNRRKFLFPGNKAETQNKDDSEESGRKNIAAELRGLGWSDMDIQDENNRSANMSLEGELASLIGDVSRKDNKDPATCGIDKTPVLALKRKALILKREGKLAEAKEELKRAKILEKQLEDQELLAEAEDSDDELSAIIQSMDNDEQDDFLAQYELEPHFDHLVDTADDFGVDSNFVVTDEDMEDPEIAAALKSIGWTDDYNNADNAVPQVAPLDRQALSKEILSLKREALNQKRAGNVAEAMAQLKKAKLLERELESFESQADNLVIQNQKISRIGSISQAAEKTTKVDDENVDFTKDMEAEVAPKSRLVIQKELLGLKKKALALRREGRLDEVEEVLKKGKVLEHQLEEMNNVSKMKAFDKKEPDLTYKDPVNSTNQPAGEGEDDVTDQDMHDPTYLSILRNLGWKDEDNELESHPSKPSQQKDNLPGKIIGSSTTLASSNFQARSSRRSKAEMQRELLGLKRKALSLRRQGKTDQAEEVLEMAKVLEAEMANMDTTNKVQVESNWPADRVNEYPLGSTVEKGEEKDITETDMHDPGLLSALKNVGWKDEEPEPETMQEKTSKEVSGHHLHSLGPSSIQTGVSIARLRSKGEIQRQLLDLKRKALAHRRKGETEEAEEFLKRAKILEAQIEELEAPKENLPDASKDMKSMPFQSLENHEIQGTLVAGVGVKTGSAPVAVASNDNAVVSSYVMKEDHPLLGESGPSGGSVVPSGRTEGTVLFPASCEYVNSMDLLTGDDWTSSQVPTAKLEGKQNFGSQMSSTASASVKLHSLSTLHEDLGSKQDVKMKAEVIVNEYNNPHVREANSVNEFASQSDQISLRREVLDHKRKAVAFKREGKLTEAREELRCAKLLEKRMEEDNTQLKPSSPASSSTSKIPYVGQNEHDSSSLAPKPLSARDRFKLQQESLNHKRKALKLRREGQTDEAEAEFEKAKNLEAKLEELAGHDSKSAASEAGAEDYVAVEDFLDPQLLSALKAIGLDDGNVVSQRQEKPEPVKLSAQEKPEPVKPSSQKGESLNQERIHLEERIKAEKVKALNLKRSGKQTEALDALRQAKLLEKKLNSLAPS